MYAPEQSFGYHRFSYSRLSRWRPPRSSARRSPPMVSSHASLTTILSDPPPILTVVIVSPDAPSSEGDPASHTRVCDAAQGNTLNDPQRPPASSSTGFVRKGKLVTDKHWRQGVVSDGTAHATSAQSPIHPNLGRSCSGSCRQHPDTESASCATTQTESPPRPPPTEMESRATATPSQAAKTPIWPGSHVITWGDGNRLQTHASASSTTATTSLGIAFVRSCATAKRFAGMASPRQRSPAASPHAVSPPVRDGHCWCTQC